ncbi:MAG TPA: sulfatase, partial [Methylomirabilota bacterium]|nr:sulfatase [Methylomirabilota bacterium]
MKPFPLVFLLGLGFACPVKAAAPQPPNFIIILVDDLGWRDLGCAGSTFFETPHIDRLASEGVRFSQAYSACTVCSPTRAALLTGKYPARLHVTDWIPGHSYPKAKLRVPDWTQHLPAGEPTLAEVLHRRGYASASIGKWHLGGEADRPEHHGFDHNIGGDHRGQPPSYFAPYQIPTLPDGPEGEYLTDRETDEAIRFIESHREQPFLLYLPRYAVHRPLQAKPAKVAKYRGKAATSGGTQTNATYAAMIESLDDSVGRLLQRLDELALSERTVVIFTSDNGGLTTGRDPSTDNAPLRAGKGSPYEGGVRVPLLVRWPGVIAPGVTNDTVVITHDLFPTVLELSGVPMPDLPANDGRSLAPLLMRRAGKWSRDAVFWHYPHYHPGGATPYGAVRAGAFKLIEFYERGHVELFNLHDDPGETVNLANQMPGKVTELRSQLQSWRLTIGAQMPTSNPDWDGKSGPASIRQSANGGVLLHARDVEIHGTTVRYEPQTNKNTVGYWTRREDWISWDFDLERTGTFAVEILQ